MKDRTIYKRDGKKRIMQHYDQYVNSFDFGVERIFVQTSYGKTHVLVAGPPEGKPVFIFQGGNCINPMTLSWFLPLIGHYRVYAPDTIGHPGFSDEHRISAKDDSFARWTKELMEHFRVERCAFVGPSYGGGIILRLAAFMPDKIDCAVLVSPAGITLGSKLRMMGEILLPLVMYQITSSPRHLDRIADTMSQSSMKEVDKNVIGDVFTYLRLEQDMPKLTTKEELKHFNAPVLIIAGEQDIFFPEDRLSKRAQEIIPNLIECKSYVMGHFPSEEHIVKINQDIEEFLHTYY